MAEYYNQPDKYNWDALLPENCRRDATVTRIAEFCEAGRCVEPKKYPSELVTTEAMDVTEVAEAIEATETTETAEPIKTTTDDGAITHGAPSMTFNVRSREELIARMKEEDPEDDFGFKKEALVGFIDYKGAIELAKAGVFNELSQEEVWNESLSLLTEEAILSEMREYMEFAWGKANNERGISASRSVQKFEAWMWLIGDDDGLQELSSVEYAPYGKPKLNYISQRYGFPVLDH